MAIKDNIKDIAIWQRGFFILLFGIISYIVYCLICLLVLFHFLMKLFTGKANEQLLKLGDGLAKYAYQLLCYITFNTESKPYPFSPWSNSTQIAKPKVEPAANTTEENNKPTKRR